METIHVSRPSLAFSGAPASRDWRRRNAGAPGAGSATDPGDHRVQTMPTASSAAAKFPTTHVGGV